MYTLTSVLGYQEVMPCDYKGIFSIGAKKKRNGGQPSGLCGDRQESSSIPPRKIDQLR